MRKGESVKPVAVFQLTTIDENSDNASDQHSTCKKHSLFDVLHQW